MHAYRRFRQAPGRCAVLRVFRTRCPRRGRSGAPARARTSTQISTIHRPRRRQAWGEQRAQPDAHTPCLSGRRTWARAHHQPLSTAKGGNRHHRDHTARLLVPVSVGRALDYSRSRSFTQKCMDLLTVWMYCNISPPPSSGSGGRENEKLRSTTAPAGGCVECARRL